MIGRGVSDTGAPPPDASGEQTPQQTEFTGPSRREVYAGGLSAGLAQ